MKQQPYNIKELKMARVANAVFLLLSTVGENGVSVSRVARRAKVSRPWIYKYIATGRPELIRFGILFTGKKLTELDKHIEIKTRAEFVDAILIGMERMFRNTEEYPHFVPVYFRFKGVQGVAGKTVELIEQDYVERQSKHFRDIFRMTQHQADFSAELLTTFRMGLAFSWQRGSLKTKARQAELLAALRDYFNGMFGGNEA